MTEVSLRLKPFLIDGLESFGFGYVFFFCEYISLDGVTHFPFSFPSRTSSGLYPLIGFKFAMKATVFKSLRQRHELKAVRGLHPLIHVLQSCTIHQRGCL